MPKKQNPIEQEIAEATGLERKPKEPDSRWRARLVRAATKLSESEWAELSEDTQKWTNAGIDALNDKKDVPNPATFDALEDEEPAETDEDSDDEDGEEPADEDSDEDEESESKDDEEPAPKPKKVKAKPAPKAKKAKAPEPDEDEDSDDGEEDAEEPTGKKKRGAIAAFRRVLVENLGNISRADAEAKVRDQGYEMAPTTTSIAWNEIRATLALLRDLGHLPALPAEEQSEAPAPKKAKKARKAK